MRSAAPECCDRERERGRKCVWISLSLCLRCLGNLPQCLLGQPGLVVQQAEYSGRIEVEEAQAERREGEGERCRAATSGHRADRRAKVA